MIVTVTYTNVIPLGILERNCNQRVFRRKGGGFFAYSWKLPAYNGVFLLTVDNFSFFSYNWSFFAYNFCFFSYNWSVFAYTGKVRRLRTLRDCKQRSLTVS